MVKSYKFSCCFAILVLLKKFFNFFRLFLAFPYSSVLTYPNSTAFQVIEQELPAIEAGCKAFDANYSPKIVVVICTKRHMNRFFETQQNGNGLAMVNLLPGSVMDEKFSTEGLQEYFMLSHNPIKVSFL